MEEPFHKVIADIFRKCCGKGRGCIIFLSQEDVAVGHEGGGSSPPLIGVGHAPTRRATDESYFLNMLKQTGILVYPHQTPRMDKTVGALFRGYNPMRVDVPGIDYEHESHRVVEATDRRRDPRPMREIYDKIGNAPIREFVQRDTSLEDHLRAYGEAIMREVHTKTMSLKGIEGDNTMIIGPGVHLLGIVLAMSMTMVEAGMWIEEGYYARVDFHKIRGSRLLPLQCVALFGVGSTLFVPDPD